MTTKLLRNISLLLLCLTVSNVSNAQVQKLYLHPKATGNEKQSNFVDSIRFIPFELKQGVSFGQYNNIQITPDYFLVTDFPNKNLLIYSKKGRFIKKINFKKQGDAFPSYREDQDMIVFFGNNKNYTLTPRDKIKIILDWNNPRNQKYYKKAFIDLSDTSFTIQKGKPGKFDVIGAYRYYDDYFRQSTISTSELYQDSLDYEIKILKGNELVKGFFPYNRINEPKFLYQTQAVYFSPTDTSYISYVLRPYSDTIYKMIKDSIFPVYKLVMPLENTLPASFFSTPSKTKVERENFNRNNGWMLRQIYNFYETPRFIMIFAGFMTNVDVYIYNKQANLFIKTKNIKPDASQYNLRLLTDMNTMRKKDKFYKLVNAGELLAFFGQNKNAVIPADLVSFLAGKPDAATPVLVEFKLKN